MNEDRDTDERLSHPSLRINRVLCLMLRTRWSSDAWAQIRVESMRELAFRREIRRAGWFNWVGDRARLVRRCAGAGRGLQRDSPQLSSKKCEEK